MRLPTLFRARPLRQKLAAATCAGLVLALAAAGFTWWQAARALNRSALQQARSGEIRFTVSRFDRLPDGVFEPVSSPAVFSDARLFGGRLFICGPSGLYGYDAQGRLDLQYRAGFELPPAPLVAMAAGRAAGAATEELYIATAGQGLLAFDGHHFRHVLPEAQRYRNVTAVLPAVTGRLLLGTPGDGVLVYDGRRLAAFHPSLAGLHVTALAGDDTALWVGTQDRGLLYWHAGQLDAPEGLPDPQVLSLAISGNAVWAGTPAGVAEFRDGRFTRVLAPGVFARALLPRRSTLAIGTEDEGVFELPLEASPGRARPAAQPLDAPVRSLFEAEGQLYALAGDRLYAAHQAARGWRETLHRDPAVLADRNISALAMDDSGRLWVGYFDRGLDILDAAVNTATHVENDHVFCVNRIVHDAGHGVTAVATANGLVLFDRAGRQRQVLGRREGLIADHVTDVVMDGAETVVATPSGLTLLGPGGPRSLYAFHGLVNNHVYALAASHDRVLAGTLGGISLLDRGAVRASYTTANSGLKHNWITAVVRAGDDWFAGTYGAGIFRLDAGGRWEAFSGARGFEVNPNAMLVTPDHIFAGTLSNGLYVFDRAAGRWRAVIAGLPSPNVTALAAAGGFIYIGTDNGLARVPEQKFVP